MLFVPAHSHNAAVNLYEKQASYDFLKEQEDPVHHSMDDLDAREGTVLTFGCNVFTRPSIISGNPVYSETSIHFRPEELSQIETCENLDNIRDNGCSLLTSSADSSCSTARGKKFNSLRG